MRILVSSMLLAAPSWAAVAAPATQPYDESADARAEIRTALADAQRTRLPVLVVFGANWCGDCQVLDKAFKEGTSGPLIAKNFKVVKVNVGRFDRNVDIAESYGVPLQKGIPTVAILSEQGKVVYASRDNELSGARSMGDKGIYKFFSRLLAQPR